MTPVVPLLVGAGVALTFVRHPDFWHVRRSGNWSQDNQQGAAYAYEVLRHMSTHDSPVLLGRVAKSIIKKGEYGAVEVGFFYSDCAAII